MAHDVFISYSSRDKAVADAVCATLEARKVRCWIAPRDVPAGQTWAGALIVAIDASRLLVLVLSDGSNRSQQVLREVGEAVDKGIPILPFRIDDVQPSRDMGYYIKSIHWLDAVTPPLEQHLGTLADQVQALLGTAAPVPVPPGPTPVPKRRRTARQWVLDALAVLLVLALVGLGARYLAPGRRSPPAPTQPVLVSLTAAPATSAASAATALVPTAVPATSTPTTTTAPASAVPTSAAEPIPPLRGVPGPAVPVGGSSVLWTADGRYLLVGGSQVFVLDAEAGFGKVRSIAGYSDDNGLALSPDGRTLAVRRSGLSLYDLESGGELRTLFEESISTGSLCGSRMDFSPDGATLAAIVGDTIQLFDVAGDLPPRTLVAQGAVSVAYARDGHGLYVAGHQGAAALDPASGDELFSIGENLGDVACATLSPDRALLATTGSWGNAIALRDAATGRLVRTLAGHEGGVTRVAFSSDGRVLASAGDDLRIRLWDVATGAELAAMVGHTATPIVLAFSPGGILASADRMGKVLLWTFQPAGEQAQPEPTPAAGPFPTLPAQSERAISPDNAGQVKLLQSAPDLGRTVVWSRDGKHLGVVAYDIAWVDASTLREVRSFPVDGSFSDLAVSPDGALLALAASGARLFEIESGAELHSLYENSVSRGSICGSFLSFSPDGATLAVQEGDVVQLYDVASGALANTLVAKGANAIAYSAGGRRVYAAGTYGLDALDVATGEATHLLGDAGSSVSCLVASADGTLLALSGWSGDSIVLWDGVNERQARTWTLAGGRLTRIAFSPAGRVLATAGDDLKIRLWDVATGAELAALAGPTDDISSLAFSPDGATLASAGRDNVVRFWGIAP